MFRRKRSRGRRRAGSTNARRPDRAGRGRQIKALPANFPPFGPQLRPDTGQRSLTATIRGGRSGNPDDDCIAQPSPFRPEGGKKWRRAERRFYELTNVGFTAAARPVRVRSADPVVRSERGRNRVFPGRSRIGRRHAALQPSRPGNAAEATRALFIRRHRENFEGRSLRAVAAGYRWLNGRSRGKGLSRSLAATPASGTGSCGRRDERLRG